MKPQRICDAAHLLRELGYAEMASELRDLARQFQWRPIAEIHEDYGDCVLMNIADTGHMEIGGNLNLDWDESKWTHFSRIVPLWREEYERLAGGTK